jgi:hypothetical protein
MLYFSFRARMLVLVVALSLVLAATGAAGPLLERRVAEPTRGALKLGASDLKKADRVQCGRAGGKWRAGLLVSAGSKRGWFLSWRTVATNNRADAAKLHGARKKALLKAAATALAKDAAGSKKCKTSATASSGSANATNSSPPFPSQLRLSFPSTVGVVQYETGRRGSLFRPRQGGVTNLDSILRNGRLQNPVVSGSIVSSYVAVGPNKDLYFATSALGVPRPDGTYPSSCFIVHYNVADNTTTCVETSSSVFGVWTSPDTGAPLQIGPNGEVYFLTSRSTIVLMRSYQGVATSMTNSNITVTGFAAAPNGAVLITGRTPSSNTNWTRVIHPDGSLSTLGTVASWSLETYPDGRIYYSGGLLAAGARAYDPATDTDVAWPDGYTDYKTSATTTDGKVFVTGSAYHTSTLFAQNYPVPGLAMKGSLDLVTAIAPAGTRVAIAGTQLSGRSRLGLYDPATDTTTLIDGSLPELEYYNLSYSPTRNVVIFDALRFQDNAYVIGEVNLATDTISITAPSARISGITGY